MKNLTELMKQAGAMQAKMKEMQDGLDALEVTGSSGAGLVSVTLSGKGKMRGLKIDPTLIDPSEKEVIKQTYPVRRVQRPLRNVSGGESYRCTLVDLFNKLK